MVVQRKEAILVPDTDFSHSIIRERHLRQAKIARIIEDFPQVFKLSLAI